MKVIAIVLLTALWLFILAFMMASLITLPNLSKLAFIVALAISSVGAIWSKPKAAIALVGLGSAVFAGGALYSGLLCVSEVVCANVENREWDAILTAIQTLALTIFAVSSALALRMYVFGASSPKVVTPRR